MKRTDVENVLIKMGMPVDLLGFDYVIDAVLAVDSNPVYKRGFHFLFLYEDVAKKHKTTNETIAKCIRHAFDFVVDNGDMDVVSHYMDTTNYTGKSAILKLHKNIENKIRGNSVYSSNSEKLNEQETIERAIEILSSKIDYDMAKVIVEIASK